MILSEEKDKNTLLTREEFRKRVLARFNGKCCCESCTKDAVDAHHIMDRKLWSDGGYYLSNGAPLCAEHHLQAEHGELSPRVMFELNEISLSDIQKPDKITELTDEEYIELLKEDRLDKWGK